MRVKFRGRKISDSCYAYGYYVEKKKKSFIVNDDGEFQVYKKTVGMYTGFDDWKTGRELYVGDSITAIRRHTIFGWHDSERIDLVISWLYTVGFQADRKCTYWTSKCEIGKKSCKHCKFVDDVATSLDFYDKFEFVAEPKKNLTFCHDMVYC